jgi:hypothetical protein
MGGFEFRVQVALSDKLSAVSQRVGYALRTLQIANSKMQIVNRREINGWVV